MSAASVSDGMQQCVIALEAAGSQHRRGLAMSAHERAALAQLWARGPMTMGEVGALIPLSRAAVTALTDRLELEGYVVRTPDALDRRKTMLSLTGVGHRMMRAIQPMLMEIEAAAEGLSGPEQQIVSAFLGQVTERARAYVEGLITLDDDAVGDVVARCAA